MSGTSIWSFRHLKHQNLSTGDDFIYSSGISLLVPFLATMEALALLTNDNIMLGISIQSYKHIECQNPSIISDSIGIPNGSKKMGEKSEEHRGTRRNTEEHGGTRRNIIHIEEDVQ